jgi:hypothetical protein
LSTAVRSRCRQAAKECRCGRSSARTWLIQLSRRSPLRPDRPMDGQVDQGPCRRHGGVVTRNRRHQHRDRVRLRFRHQTQQRAPTRRQTQHLGQARARPSCQRQPDRLQHGAQHRTATRYGTVRPGICSAKVRASHFLVVAEQPSNSKRNQRLAATDRRIIQPPLVSTVHPLGRTIAPWTHRRPGTDMASKDDATTPRSIPLHGDTANPGSEFVCHPGPGSR